MNSPGTVRIPLDRIDVGERLRKVDPDYAAWIAASMAEIGQITPIEVRPVGHANAHRYRLTAGEHRLEGAKLNAWPDIEARVVKATDLQAELREIVENLVRHELNALDRATALARMQAVYEALNPETVRGKAGAEARWHAKTKLGFASATTDKLRMSKTDFNRAVRRHNKIVPDVREKIAGTWIAAKGVELDALVRLEPDEQRKAVKLMLQAAHPASSVAAAVKAIRGVIPAVQTVDDQQYEKLLGAWRKAGAKARREFIDHLRKEGALGAPGAAA
jgi:ParB family chromosome partitioning protein